MAKEIHIDQWLAAFAHLDQRFLNHAEVFAQQVAYHCDLERDPEARHTLDVSLEMIRQCRMIVAQETAKLELLAQRPNATEN